MNAEEEEKNWNQVFNSANFADSGFPVCSFEVQACDVRTESVDLMGWSFLVRISAIFLVVLIYNAMDSVS